MSEHDPVEEFFARERGEVRDLPGGPDHWEGLVAESRRPARRGWLPYLGAAAAAVVVVGAIGYGTTANRTDHTNPATASRGLTPTVTQGVTPPATTSGPSPATSSGGTTAATASTGPSSGCSSTGERTTTARSCSTSGFRCGTSSRAGPTS